LGSDLIDQFLDVETLVNYRLKLLLIAAQKVVAAVQKKLDRQNDRSGKILPR
jgi:hypothetical protein